MEKRQRSLRATKASFRIRLRQAALAGVGALGVLAAQAATNLTGSVVVSGASTSNSPGGCYRLTTSLGQPAVGSAATGGTFSVQGGFLPGHGDTNSIFHGSFEVCS